MPTYEYECEKCGKRFDVFQSITAEPLTKCNDEACGGTVKRLFSPGAGFIFKGSGFYITDYRSDSYKKGAQSDPGASSSSDSTSKSTSSSTSTTGKSASTTSSPSTKSSSTGSSSNK